MSFPTSSLIRLNGKPHTWIQNGCFENVMNLTDIPFSHHRRARRWLSKQHGPLFQTHIIWLSNKNLNCNSPSPTSMIFMSSPSFHIDRNKLFAARMFICFDVRNCPIRLRENSSNIFSLFTEWIDMASSSSIVSFMFCIRSRTSDSMVKASACLLAESSQANSWMATILDFPHFRKKKIGSKAHTMWEGKLLHEGEKNRRSQVPRLLNWINLKFEELNWIKVKLEN